MGVIVKWFIADNDEQAATAIGGWDELHGFPTADVGLTATYAWPHLEAILTGRAVDDIKADGGHTFVAAVGDGDVGIMRLSPGLVRSVGEAPDDTVPIIARSWAEATGHEPGEDEARWILQQAVPLFRRALTEGLNGYEFSCV